MRRRLSLAVSMIGDPAVVFADEPTSGLDPAAKRFMWSLIESFKEGRCLVLTTHSMEEADTICSRIGIMGHGSLRCIGSSRHLKAKFSNGHKVEVRYREGYGQSVLDFMQQFPGCETLAEEFGQYTFHVPTESASVSEVSKQMTLRTDASGIHDWTLRQTSMEDVFLAVARSSRAEQAALSEEPQSAEPGIEMSGVTGDSAQLLSSP